MAGDLSFLFGGTPPPSVTGGMASVQGLPDWYQEYLRGIAGQATSLAGMQADQAVPAQSVAGFTPDQTQAFQQVRDNQGVWQPDISQASGALGTVMPSVQGAVGTANQAVSGPAGTAAGTTQPYLSSAMGAASSPISNWTQSYSNYMSPYTQSVVDNIGRLGQRNFNENIMPGVNESMIGSGQFGSTRNADILSRAARDASADITGQQANAMEQGYGTAANIFSSDASRQLGQNQLGANTALGAASTFGTLSAEDAGRQQQQQQIQANTALTGGQLGASTGINLGQQYGALGSTTSALGLNDAQQLSASGQQQQALDQAGYNTAYGNAQNLNNWDWNILGNLDSVVRGMQLPTSTTTSFNTPATNNYSFGTSPLQQVGSAVFGTSGGKKAGGRIMPRRGALAGI